MPKAPIDWTTRYAEQVTGGKILAGRMVRLACQRHLDDLKHGKKRGLHFDVAEANRVFDFFSELRLTEGDHDGKPFLLEPSQKFIIGSIFGWKVKDGTRRFRTAYIEQGKGNGKSPLAAGIGLYGLVADRENGAEIYSAAVSKDQAKILFRDAEHMVDASPMLKDHVQSHVSNLSVGSTYSYFRPVSSEHKGLDGKRVHMALIDEVHVHSDSMVVDKMRAGTKGRRQALIFMITNSGTDRHSVCWHYHELARKIVEGHLENDSFFAYVCQLDPCESCRLDGKDAPVDGCQACDDWRDPKVWVKANPCLGVTITKRYIEEQVAEAVQMPSKENIVKRLNLCMWTEQVVRWMPMTRWDSCSQRVDRAALRGKPCMVGLDLATRVDIAACVLVFGDARDGYDVLPFFWVPKDRAEHREQVDHVPYLTWHKEGLVSMTDGASIDYDVIRSDIKTLGDEFNIREIGYDPWNATQIAGELTNDGFTMVELRQGFATLSEPTKELEKLTLEGKLRHGGNPVLRWMASNAAVKSDAPGNIMLAKDRSIDKIDGMAALVFALSRCIVNHGSRRSIYEDRGLLAF